MKLAVHVQHHPKRAHLIGPLLERLGPATVVIDPEPNGRPAPIRTYLACLERFPGDATHLLVIQDDALPCDGFRALVEQAVEEKPADLLALFLAGAPARSARLAQRAHLCGERWSLLHAQDWCPTVALVWPHELADRFLVFCAQNKPLLRMGDDNVVGTFKRREGIAVWVTVPSLVQHPDREVSLIGRKAASGKNPYRVAAVPFAG